jgi:BMFP domain-containing protein YqiC
MNGERPSLSDPKVLDDLARRLVESLPKGARLLQEDLERNFRAALEAAARRLDLVTREELEVQAGVLARTREKVEALQRRIDELERRERASGPASSG